MVRWGANATVRRQADLLSLFSNKERTIKHNVAHRLPARANPLQTTEIPEQQFPLTTNNAAWQMVERLFELIFCIII